ncbi:7-cyano-7-deazaguanine synthase QueC [Thauera sp. Sel9]|uniref:7-cyano-7-deazaguanine synthase QueC n=1 Tax=Thauera sp. Sel9 TaxID=2974299 RepID=UPI0021E17858|nr:7-cyano-7-deazaguanine synthase QueC [Thauera sp. Sel9]MCV2218722.1 7-cyano-7-deazaguanine synthase QueC [Thauera sp. Sel9]
MTQAKRAVVLLSGGLDSATCLAIAHDQGFDAYALSVAYGQRHTAELTASLRVAQALGAREHRLARIDLGQFGGSALTDPSIEVPEDMPADGESTGIPVTYVPARNTVMLSIAMAWAEVLGANDIFIGVNAVDYSGYPDCRPAFIQAFETMANLATRAGVEGARLRIHAPLIDLSKADIISRGTALGVDYGITVTCYQADDAGRACGRCEACRLRAAGFAGAGVADPTPYQLRSA